jgi:hypothetical protein
MGATWKALKPGLFGRHAGISGADPMWIWADATGYRDLGWRGGPPARVWVVTDPKGGLASRSIQPGDDLQDFVTAELAMPVIPERMPPAKTPAGEIVEGPVTPSLAGRVLVGIIDSGCPFAAPMLRSADGRTRVLGLWDQDDAPAFAVGGYRPHGIGYGRAIRRDGLNDYMALATSPSGQVDEASCYRMAGCRSLKRSETHGAAVVGQLFGRPLRGGSLQPRPGEPPRWDEPADTGALPIDEADLVFVDIPREGLQDASSGALSRYIIDGLRFVLAHAVKGQRVVVNISTGTSRTTHDGRSIIERALRQFVQDARDRGIELHIVLPAGNGNMEQRHALLHSGRSELSLFIPPGCESPQYVTVRWPEGATDLGLRITSPDGAQEIVKHGQAVGLFSHDGPCAGVVMPPAAAGEPARSLLAFNPTASFDPETPRAPAGRWRIALAMGPDADRLLAEPVRFWISRNHRNPGALQRGRQADFVDIDRKHNARAWKRLTEGDVETVIDGISRAGACTGLATAGPAQDDDPHLWVVGSTYATTPDRPSRYSAGGEEGRGLPSASTPGDASRALQGLSMRGRSGGEILRMMGTSFAAPLFARALVNGKLPQATQGQVPKRLGPRLLRPR